MSSPSDGGLQAERTGLAWSRTALAVTANVVLLGIHQARADGLSGTLLPAGVGLLVALATAVYGRRRSRQLRRAPLPTPLAATSAVPALGWAVVVLAALTGVTLVLA